MKATNIDGRRNADGSVDLRFSTDIDAQEVTLDPAASTALLAVALGVAPPLILDHDGFRLGRSEGMPVLSFRFGPDRWLSIRLGPLDLETLEGVLPNR